MDVRRVVGIFGVIAATVVAPACSPGRVSAPAGGADAALLALVESHCTDLSAPGLGEGTLCVDNGFRPEKDDFSFVNWGRSARADGNVTVQTLVDLFGRAAVCAPGPATECILRPATVQRLEEWNNALAGGRCEGFAALSTRFHLGMEHPSDYRQGAAEVADLRRDDARLDAALAYWWATQFLPEVADRAARSRTRSPLTLVDEIIVGLAGGLGLTVGLYDEGTGHSVVPFAVTRRDGDFVVHIYDNNHPGERREIFVDPVTDTWSYPRAVRGTDASWIDWSGGTGTFEVTPMSARRGPFRCDFCAALVAGADTEISIASREPTSSGRLRITSTAGTFEVTGTGITNTITGATWKSVKGGTANLVVSVPATAGDLDITVVRDLEGVPAGDVVVGVRRPGNPDVQVQGDLAAPTGDATPVVMVRSDGTTVTAPPQGSARVSIASATGLSRTTVAPGDELVVRTLSPETIEVALKGVGVARLVDDMRTVERVLAPTPTGLGVESAVAEAMPVSPARTPGFSRAPKSPPTTAVTTTTDPDSGPAPSIVVTLPD